MADSSFYLEGGSFYPTTPGSNIGGAGEASQFAVWSSGNILAAAGVPSGTLLDNLSGFSSTGVIKRIGSGAYSFLKSDNTPSSLLSLDANGALVFTGNFSVAKSVTGSFPLTEAYLNEINVTSDVAAAALGLNYFGVDASFGGVGLTGTRSAALFNLTQIAPNTSNTIMSNGLRYYVGVTSNVFVNGSGDGGTAPTLLGALGGYYGANFTTRSTATNVLYNIGCEANNFGTSAATQAYQIGFNSLGLFANHGAVFDAAFCAAMGASTPYGGTSPGPGWKIGYAVAELANGYYPIDPTNGAAFSGFVQTLSTIPCKYVLDLRAFTATTSQIIGTGFNIDGAGAATFGPGTGQYIFRINGGNGSGLGGLLEIGEAGSYLTSLGTVGATFGGSSGVTALAGFSGLNFYTNNVIAVSIDTAQNVTFATKITAPDAGTWVAAGLAVAATTAATSTITGALRSAGGLGVVGAAFIGGALNVVGSITGPDGGIWSSAGLSIAATTAASSPTTGALRSAGGLGVSGAAYVGGDIFIGTGTGNARLLVNLSSNGGIFAGYGGLGLPSVLGLTGPANSTGITGFFGLQFYTNNVQALAIDTAQNITVATKLTLPDTSAWTSSGLTHSAQVTGVDGSQWKSTGFNLASGKTLSVNAVQVVTARQTGWTVATGTPSRATFATGSVSLATLAGVVMALEQDLIAHGLIGP